MIKTLTFVALSVGVISAHATVANLLENPGFESGLDAWQHTARASIRLADPAPYEGSKYVFGDSTASFSVWQDVDLLAAGYTATQIDDGLLAATFGGFQSGWHTQHDYGQISLSFLDGQLQELGSTALPTFFSNNTWVEQTGSAMLLEGTRTLRYKFVGTRVAGSNNDGYLDAAYLTVSAVPEPESAAMLLTGLGLVGAVVRRRIPHV